MISLVTVPKTGTIYTLQLLRGWGVDVERKHIENTDEPPYGNERFGPGFPCPSTDEWELYPSPSRRIVCTLRDPILAVISEINRGVPDRMISVDGWAVMADWWEREIDVVHFFRVPPTRGGLVELADFVGARAGWMHDAPIAPRNTSEDRTGLRAAYGKVGLFQGLVELHPTIARAVEHLQEMPAVERLFRGHGFRSLPWFRGGL